MVAFKHIFTNRLSYIHFNVGGVNVSFIKILLILIFRAFLRIFYIFKIDEKRIMYISYDSLQFSCNPKYLYEYLKINRDEFKSVWSFVNPQKFKINSIKVKKNSVMYFYYLLTSKFIITNTYFGTYIPYRKRQVIVNTWHGGGAYKKVAMATENSSYNRFFFKIHNKHISYFISNCEEFTERVLKESFNYNGKVLNFGMPRNTMFYKNGYTNAEVKNKLNLSKNTRIVLYAPTSVAYLSKGFKMLDVDMMLKLLDEKFGLNFIFLYRLHHSETNLNIFKEHRNLINVSDYDDMQELLLISDVLISDYSSSIWDFSITHRPIFLFLPDYNLESINKKLYTPINEWPYPVAFTFEELIKNIRNFDDLAYRTKIDQHQLKLGSYENRDSVEKIEKVVFKEVI